MEKKLTAQLFRQCRLSALSGPHSMNPNIYKRHWKGLMVNEFFTARALMAGLIDDFIYEIFWFNGQ
jgi:hypothetical protein